AIGQGDRLDQRVASRLDPQVHRVEPDEPRLRALLADPPLQIRLDVREEQDIRPARSLGELGLAVREYPQPRLHRAAVVQVPAVLPTPEERLSASDVFDVRRVNSTTAQDVI